MLNHSVFVGWRRHKPPTSTALVIAGCTSAAAAATNTQNILDYGSVRIPIFLHVLVESCYASCGRLGLVKTEKKRLDLSGLLDSVLSTLPSSLEIVLSLSTASVIACGQVVGVRLWTLRVTDAGVDFADLESQLSQLHTQWPQVAAETKRKMMPLLSLDHTSLRNTVIQLGTVAVLTSRGVRRLDEP